MSPIEPARNGFLQMPPQTQYVEDQNLNKLYNDLNNRASIRTIAPLGPEYHEGTRQLENQIKTLGGNPYGYFSQSGGALSDQEKKRASQDFNMTNALMGNNYGGGGYGPQFQREPLGYGLQPPERDGPLTMSDPRGSFQNGIPPMRISDPRGSGLEKLGPPPITGGPYPFPPANPLLQDRLYSPSNNASLTPPPPMQQGDEIQWGIPSNTGGPYSFPPANTPLQQGGMDPLGQYPKFDNQYQGGGLLYDGPGDITMEDEIMTLPSLPSTGPSNTAAYGGLALGGLLSGDFTGALQGAAGYYAGQEGIEGALGAGTAGFNLSEQLGKRASDATQFKPFGVTSNLANVQADPTGNLSVNLSPQQQAMQSQLMGKAGGFFDQVGQDPSTAQAQLYEQMRATQRPEEQRQRLALEERMLSQGRLGISSNAYGGSSPELLAQETAIQEAMARANLGARQQSMSEQSQAAELGGMFQGLGYQPQQQALSMFGSGLPSAELAQRGQQRGAELQAVAGGQGVESYMQGANMANLLQQQQMQGLMSSAFGQAPTMQEQLINRVLNPNGGMLTNEGGLVNQGLNWLGDKLGFGGSTTPNYGTATPDQINYSTGATPEQIAAAAAWGNSYE